MDDRGSAAGTGRQVESFAPGAFLLLGPALFAIAATISAPRHQNA
jgi:hypothetical protein